MLPGMNLDAAVLYRVDQNADTEGNYDGSTLTKIADLVGTLGLASATEQEQAAQRGQTIDNVFATDFTQTFHVGDIVSVGSASWTVVEVRNNRLNQRVFLRQR